MDIKRVLGGNEMSEVQAPYTYTMTSFSGADMVVHFDGKVIGELQEVRWKKNLDEFKPNKITGTIKAVVFEQDPIGKYEQETFDILIRFQNEYGGHKLEFIKGVNLLTKDSGISVDDIIQYYDYTFEARDSIVIESPLKTPQEQLQFALLNEKSYDQKLKMEADAYKALLSYRLEGNQVELVDKVELNRLRRLEKEGKHPMVEGIVKEMKAMGMKFE
jgi:hypothetical protein